jgi:hypothetical protein
MTVRVCGQRLTPAPYAVVQRFKTKALYGDPRFQVWDGLGHHPDH